MIFPKEILSQNVSKMYIPVLNSILQVTIQGQFVIRKQAKAQLINASSKMFAVVIHSIVIQRWGHTPSSLNWLA